MISKNFLHLASINWLVPKIKLYFDMPVIAFSRTDYLLVRRLVEYTFNH